MTITAHTRVDFQFEGELDDGPVDAAADGLRLHWAFVLAEEPPAVSSASDRCADDSTSRPGPGG